MYKYAFFDLDGTLTQSEFGIINSIVYALVKMGYEKPDRESVMRFIGPPLVLAFKDFYKMSDEDAKKAASIYREYYNAGEMYNAPLYDGIEDTLKRLAESGVELYVVTSKPKVFSEKIVDHFGILKYFRKVVGPELSDVNYSKQELIRAAMDYSVRGIFDNQTADDSEDRINQENVVVDPAEYIMVGDRKFDIEGAVLNGIDSIGALFGYGTKEELEKAGATYFAENAGQIADTILK